MPFKIFKEAYDEVRKPFKKTFDAGKQVLKNPKKALKDPKVVLDLMDPMGLTDPLGFSDPILNPPQPESMADVAPPQTSPEDVTEERMDQRRRARMRNRSTPGFGFGGGFSTNQTGPDPLLNVLNASTPLLGN